MKIAHRVHCADLVQPSKLAKWVHRQLQLMGSTCKPIPKLNNPTQQLWRIRRTWLSKMEIQNKKSIMQITAEVVQAIQSMMVCNASAGLVTPGSVVQRDPISRVEGGP